MSLAHVARSATKFAVKVAKSKFVGVSWIDSLSTIVAEYVEIFLNAIFILSMIK